MSITSFSAITKVMRLIGPDLHTLNTTIRRSLTSNVDLVNQVLDYVLSAQGKRIRPALLLLMSRALSPTQTPTQTTIDLAAVIELIHTATLLHDDVVDGAILRRGQEATHIQFDPSTSVLVGDFIYSRAFQMMTVIQNTQVMSILAKATNALAEGELNQLSYCHHTNVSQQQYFDVIAHKTASLFSVSTQAPALLANKNDSFIKQCHDYGFHLGLLFQMVDDILDYEGNKKSTGKPIGTDLSEGKMTLPLILCLASLDTERKHVLTQHLEQQKSIDFDEALALIHETKALDQARSLAKEHAQQAEKLAATFPPSVYQEALLLLPRLVLGRKQ